MAFADFVWHPGEFVWHSGECFRLLGGIVWRVAEFVWRLSTIVWLPGVILRLLGGLFQATGNPVLPRFPLQSCFCNDKAPIHLVT